MVSFDSTVEQLEAVFDQIPILAGTPRALVELTGGLTNRNFKVTTPDGVFVARCSDVNAQALAIDRAAEFHNTTAAATAGVGAPVHDHRPDLGVLVVGFIEGRTLAAEDLADPGMLGRIAQGCRQLHAGPRFAGEFNMFERQRGYLATARSNGFRIPAGYDEHAGRVEQIRKALTVQDEGTVPCNNDLLAANFIDDGEKIWLIDYEYAGNNDPCFELGNIWAESRLEDDQLEALVTAYYGRHRRSRLARARLLGVVGMYGWTLWGAIQNAVSPIDYDFWGWATERFEGAERELCGPGLDGLLDDAQLND